MAHLFEREGESGKPAGVDLLMGRHLQGGGEDLIGVLLKLVERGEVLAAARCPHQAQKLIKAAGLLMALATKTA